jgi:thiol-disulfide isomerase/thioredoxin
MLATLLLAATVAAPALPRPYPLMAGDPAPPLAVQSWVKGQPVTRFEPGKVYVVDFWATWCGPCKTAMPALSAIQREYGERVTIVGVDTWDYADRVAPFVETMGERIAYRVAIDRQPAPPDSEDNVPMFVKRHGACSQTWMEASGYDEEGIPTLFVVDGQGRIAWVGGEVDSLAPVLRQVVAGSWDLPGYAGRYAADAVVAKQGRTLQRRAFEARKRKDWRAAIAEARTLTELAPRYEDYAGLVFRLTWRQLADRAAAVAYGDSMLVRNRSAQAFVEMAEAIAADSLAGSHVAAGEKYARHAVALTADASPAPYAALAALAMRRGDGAEAVRMQTRAVERTRDPEERQEAEKRLAEYRR